jgi:hypothetical protein
MRARSRRALAAIVAISALSAGVAASASAALPEFKIHKATFTGTVPGVLWEGPGKAEYICKEEGSLSGHVVGPNEVAKVVITFKGCGAGLCQTSGLKEGEWKTNELQGKLGYISKASKKVGLLLESPTGVFAECKGGFLVKFLGSTIGEIGPVNKERSPSEEFGLTYVGTSGENEWRHFEGEEALHLLERIGPGEPEHLAMTSKMNLKFAESQEIIA